MVRVTVNNDEAAAALPRLVAVCGVPLVADIHFRHDLALRALDAGIAKLRINPGDIGSRDKAREVAAKVEQLARDLPPETVISVMGCIVNGGLACLFPTSRRAYLCVGWRC